MTFILRLQSKASLPSIRATDLKPLQSTTLFRHQKVKRRAPFPMQYASAHAKHVGFDGNCKVSLEATKLHPTLKQTLEKKLKIKDLFDMQEKVFAHVQTLVERCRTGDIVLRAPTGSGKTLAYALPISQALINRVVSRLRVVVVVPTRDLANQVANVFQALTDDVGIVVETAVGSSSVESESLAVCKAEVLVSTPGRLVYHVENTKDFVLSHVRYLVLDESDRLLEDSYQDWVSKLLPLLGRYDGSQTSFGGNNQNQGPGMGIFAVAMVPHVTARNSSMYSGVSQECVRKFLVSATQTTNPMRLHDLDLRNPTFFHPNPTTGYEKMTEPNVKSAMCTVPPTLTERGWVVKELHEKPAGLLVLLGWVKAVHGEKARKNDQGENIFERHGVKLVFTHSVESAHRLSRLLEIYAFALDQKGDILEMSGDLSMERRKFVLSRIRAVSDTSAGGEPNSERFLIVVCSDVLARGMDMVNVDTIINYDAPVHINKYLHRAGRTARAGRPGTVYTLILEKQAHHFRQMVREADRGEKKVITRNLTVDFPEHSSIPRIISSGLSSLRRVLKREGLGLLTEGESLPGHTLHELRSSSTTDELVEDKQCQPDYSRMANVLHDSHRYPEKRLRVFDPTEPTRHGPNSERYEDDIADRRIEGGEDGFADLLFSQVARGLSKAHAER